ncbi:MAG: cation:proton antiporter [Aggregatilineales bacterium]
MNLDTILETIGVLFLILGVLFSGLGVLGVLRLPDTYSRLHASGKTSILGVVSLCIGASLLMPSASLKLIVLAAFMIFSGPVVSHSIAASVHRLAAIRRIEHPEATVVSGVHNVAQVRQMVADAQRDVLDTTEAEILENHPQNTDSDSGAS